jgi:hypothetical protein
LQHTPFAPYVHYQGTILGIFRAQASPGFITRRKLGLGLPNLAAGEGKHSSGRHVLHRSGGIT